MIMTRATGGIFSSRICVPDGVCIAAVDQTVLKIRASGAASAFGQGGCWRVSSSLANTGRPVALSGSAGTRAPTLAWPSGVQSGILAVLELLMVRSHCHLFFIVHGAVRARCQDSPAIQ